MFEFFIKKKCPVCGMKLEDKRNYPEAFGKTFCSEQCRETYRKKMDSPHGGAQAGSCH